MRASRDQRPTIIALIGSTAAILGAASAAPPQGVGATAPSVVALGADRTIGAGQSFENLSVFPIYAKAGGSESDIGDFATLDAALEEKTAEVSEKAGGAQVNSLVVRNRGKKVILVLAGTVVKGGNQDRQIGQDFVVAPGQSVPVDAFCVEQGRWQGTRNGAATAGKFKTVKSLALAEVRGAAQYDADQGKVWAKVGEANAKHKKSSGSGTLMATLDDKDVVARRTALAGKVNAWLGGVPDRERTVGLAYAVDGRVRGVRMFLGHRIFDQFRETLVNTMVLDGLTAQAATAQAAADPRAPRPAAAPPVTAQSVQRFVTEVRAVKAERRKETAAGNVNTYRENEQGYGSQTTTRVKDRSLSVTEDYLAK